jgi:hypothetical protein
MQLAAYNELRLLSYVLYYRDVLLSSVTAVRIKVFT